MLIHPPAMVVNLYFVYFSFINYLYFSSSINKKSPILHEKNVPAMRFFTDFIFGGHTGR